MLVLRDVVSFLAVVCTVALYSTGILVCKKIMRKGSANETSFFPFMVMFCSSTLWVKYGILKSDGTLILVNSVGTLLCFVYIVVFYSYTTHKRLLYLQLTFGCLLTLPPLIYVRSYAMDHDDTLHCLGLFCIFISVLAYGSPLFSFLEVIRSQSTACMTFSLSVANFVVSLEWLTYGLVVQDFFIQVPNLLGVVLGFLQLSLFCKYPQHRERTLSLHASVGRPH